MADLEALIAVYCRLLDPTPVGFVCFDRALAIIHATAPEDQLPLDALQELARRVVDSGVAEQGVTLQGFGLAASCTPLRIGDETVGVACAIENASLVAENRDLVMLADDAIAMFDERQRLVFANVAWETLVAHDAPRLTIARATLALVLEGGHVARDPIMFDEHGLTGIARPFVSALGAMLGVVIACRQRTAADRASTTRAHTRRALAEAQRVSRQKDQFIATVSHELRAPLATMLLWERILRDESIDAPTRARALDAIHESATAQSCLVADLLDVSRAINGKLAVQRQDVVVEDVIRAVVEAARPYAITRDVAVTHEIDDVESHVLGDANRLRQVFANLVNNAIRSTSAGGRVVVKLRREADVVQVEVADTGRGIAPDLLLHLFEPFRQGAESSGELGLGLAVAHQLVMLHDGTIVAASEGLDRGATFTVGIPIATSSRASKPPARPVAQLDGVHVLVVDDDPRVLDAIQIILSNAGAIVDTARSADDGCGAVERSMPDIVLSDLAMPDGDGCSMLRRIRAREVYLRIPAVAMTAHVADANRRDAMAAGFDRYLTKPLDVDQLIATLASLVHAR